jgi:predicted PurR-regulated permease PerM
VPENGQLTRLPRAVAFLLGLAIVLGLLVVGRDFLLPLVMAIFIVVLANDASLRLSNITVIGRILPAWLARLLGFAAVIGILTGLAYFVSAQAEEISAQLPNYVERFSIVVARLEASLGERLTEVVREALANIDLSAGVSGAADYVSGIFGALGMTLLYAGFLFAERHQIPKKIANLAAGGSQTADWVKTIMSLLVGGLSYVVLRLVGVDFAESWALVIFALNFIPVLGSALGVVLPALHVAVQFIELGPVLTVVVALSVVQFTIGNLVEPKFTGRSLNLSPFGIIFALTFWGAIWGTSGVLLSVPITVVLAITCANVPGWNWVAILLSEDGELAKPDDGESKRTPTPAPAEPEDEAEIEGLRRELDALKSQRAEPKSAKPGVQKSVK